MYTNNSRTYIPVNHYKEIIWKTVIKKPFPKYFPQSLEKYWIKQVRSVQRMKLKEALMIRTKNIENVIDIINYIIKFKASSPNMKQWVKKKIAQLKVTTAYLS